MQVNLVKLPDGTFDVSNKRQAVPGDGSVDVQIPTQAYRKWRKADQAFDVTIGRQMEFAWRVSQPEKVKPPACPLVIKPVIVPESRPLWERLPEHLRPTGPVHHRPKPMVAGSDRVRLPIQPSGDRARSTWNVERMAAFIAEKHEPILWRAEEQAHIRRMNKIHVSSSDIHITVAGSLMPPDRWMWMVSKSLDNRIRWHRGDDAAFDLYLEATLELISMESQRHA